MQVLVHGKAVVFLQCVKKVNKGDMLSVGTSFDEVFVGSCSVGREVDELPWAFGSSPSSESSSSDEGEPQAANAEEV